MPSETSVVSGDQSMEELKRELAEAREQQAVTAEILAAISSSPSDPSRVFAEIAASAARLCGANDATIHQIDGELLRLVAQHGSILTGPTMRLERGALIGRAVIERQAIQIADLSAEKSEYPAGSAAARRLGFRTTLAVPLIRAGNAIGVISIRRAEVRPFTDRQIDLLKTFADQAVIAIENARLFDAEQSSKRELQESLEYQTATSEVLNVISRSPTDTQPVFDIIAERAEKLCDADISMVSMVDGELIRLAAIHGTTKEGIAAIRAVFPMDCNDETVTARVIRTCAIVHVADVLTDPQYEIKDAARRSDYRSVLGVPMSREGRVIGSISVGRREPGFFADALVELLKTFADQAVIAIENTRLFEAEQASKRELQESLKYQIAISEVLSVISRSQTQIRPVFDAILESAVRLCDADQGGTGKVENGMLLAINWYPDTPEVAAVFRDNFP